MTDPNLPDIKMDATALYKEEIVTDQKVGTIRIMTPIHADGSPDLARAVHYVGQAQMMTPAGALPLTFELEADNLADAIDLFAEEAKKAMERTIEELKEYRRQAASSIVVPGGGGGMGGGMGGMPGGGKIQLR